MKVIGDRIILNTKFLMVVYYTNETHVIEIWNGKENILTYKETAVSLKEVREEKLKSKWNRCKAA